MNDVAAIMKTAGFDSPGPGFVDPDQWCWDDHVGPIVVSGTEPIDNGVALTMRCETCKATTDTSVDLDELEWN